VPKKWDEESVVSILLDLYEKNGRKPYNISFLSKNGYGTIRTWLYTNYGSPFNFCKDKNISYVIKNGREIRKWTEDRIVEAIKEAYRIKGSPIHDKWLAQNGYATPLSRLKRDGYSLYTFAEKHGISDIIEVKYRAKGYTEEEIVKDFIKLYERINKPLCDTLLKENGMGKQVSYIRKHFGGLDYFVQKHNLTGIFEKRYSPLTDEEVVSRVKDLYVKLNQKIGMKDIQRHLSGCAHYIYRNFGDFETFCKEKGIMYLYEYKGGISWSEDVAKEIIVKLFNKNKSKVTYSDIQSEGLHGLLHYIRRNFGSINSFIEKLQLDDYMCVSEFSKACEQGMEFEKLVKETFLALGYNFIYQSDDFDGIRPDFYFTDTDTIIDTKLSSYTAFNLNNNFFSRYTSQCSNLIIVYLRGPNLSEKRGKIKFLPIDHYYSDLERIGRQDLIRKFKKLKDDFESIYTKAV
jgi:hypothetical protein